MPAPPSLQPPPLTDDDVESGVLTGGRQIFIDDTNRDESKLSLDLAYTSPFLFGETNRDRDSQRNDRISDILHRSIIGDGRENLTSVYRNWNLSDESDQNRFWPFAIDMQHLFFVAMCLCLVTLVLIIIVALKLRHIYLRWRRRRRAGPRIAIIEAQASANVQTPQCTNNGRRGLLSRMLARIEEFDSLTPLIITPNSLSDDDHVPMQQSTVVARQHSADRISTATNTGTNTPVSFRGSPRRRPRCMAGKVTLFPLATNARRADAYVATELASDSGGDSLRFPANHVYRVPANGILMRNPFEDLDLVSIDRTSGASTLDRRHTSNDLLGPTPAHDTNTAAALALSSRQPIQPQQYQQTQNRSSTAIGGSSAADIYPLSTLPSPASTDVLIPASELHSLNHASSAASNNNGHKNNHRPNNTNGGNNHYRFVIKRESSSIDSLTSNLSSPMDSSICGDTGSPLDTTGSLAELSDSVYMASESENSEAAKTGRVYSVETGATQRWYTVSAPGGAGSGGTGTGSGNDGSDRSEPDLSTFEFETPALKRYVLHRIEEESVDDMAAAGTTATSSTPGDRSKRSGTVSTSKNGKK